MPESKATRAASPMRLQVLFVEQAEDQQIQRQVLIARITVIDRGGDSW